MNAKEYTQSPKLELWLHSLFFGIIGMIQKNVNSKFIPFFYELTRVKKHNVSKQWMLKVD